MTVAVEGEINTLTAPELEKSIGDLRGVSKLIFDLERVRYVSSAGLRLLLNCQRTMTACGGDMRIQNCNPYVAETFMSVGYDRIMKLEGIQEGSITDAGSEK